MPFYTMTYMRKFTCPYHLASLVMGSIWFAVCTNLSMASIKHPVTGLPSSPLLSAMLVMLNPLPTTLCFSPITVADTFILIYVDDIIIVGNDDGDMQRLKDVLHAQFHIKDLGHLKYFLDIEVACSPNGIFLSQLKYTLGILKDTSFLGARITEFPME